MARAKKQADEIIEIEAENVSAESDAPEIPPPIMVKTVERREYVAPMEAPRRVQAEPEPVYVVEEADFPAKSEPEDTMEARLRKEVGLSSDRWSMTVYRLLKYHVDGNASLNGNALAIITKPFDLDTYVDTILESCLAPDKPNDFLVVVRRNNRVYCHLPVLRAEAVARPEQPATQQGQTNNAISAAVTPVDPFAEMKKAMRFMKELRELEAPAAPQSPAGEVSIENAVLKVIASDPEQVAKIAKRLLPGDSGNDDAMPAWVQALLPVVTPLLAGIAQRFLTPQQPQAAQQPQASNVTPREIPPEPPPQFHKYVELVNRLVAGLEKGYSPAYVGENFDIECNADELLIPFCNPLLSMPPATLQAELIKTYPQAAATLARPESLEWLAEFLAYFQPENEGDESQKTN